MRLSSLGLPKVDVSPAAILVQHVDDMGANLCFMAVKLLELHSVLRPDGSFYLLCDLQLKVDAATTFDQMV